MPSPSSWPRRMLKGTRRTLPILRRAWGLERSWRHSALHLLLGLALGAGLVGLVLSALTLAGWVHVTGPAPWPAGAGDVYRTWFARRLLWQALSSVAEVTLLCGLFLGALRRVLPCPLAVSGAALLFGALHFARPHITPPMALSVAVVVGLPCLAAFLRWHSLWAATGFHFAWNVALGPVFGAVVAGQKIFGLLDTTDTTTSGPALWTGGLYGPEGSLTACVLCGGVSVALLWAKPKQQP